MAKKTAPKSKKANSKPKENSPKFLNLLLMLLVSSAMLLIVILAQS